MYRLRKAALLLSVVAVVALTAGVCSADYQFDDLPGPSGVSSQWMVINETGDTFGACLPVEDFDPESIEDSLSEFVVTDGRVEHQILIHMGVYEVVETDKILKRD